MNATCSKTETAFAKALFAFGQRYSKDDQPVFGKPILTFKKIKLAIFINSEFSSDMEKTRLNINMVIRATENFHIRKLSVTYSETWK